MVVDTWGHGKSGGLAVYKYASFLIGNANRLLETLDWGTVPDPKITLPIGISFYIFQITSYLVDVYRRDVPPQPKVTSLALYVSLFPQLIAGPIVRYTTICEDLENRKTRGENVFYGLHRFVIGLAKKVILADTMASVADRIFDSDVTALPCGFAWIGVVAYALQIYFDFSGYSDMAIGLGRILNFRFLENFNHPYCASSIQEFWHRWHISLSTWFRDYLYIPLGGNRKGSFRTYMHLVIVFALCGLWHGAAWNFAVWGLYHGAGLVIERAGISKVLKRIPKVVGNLYMWLFILVGWVLFRAPSMTSAWDYITIMFSGNPDHPFRTFYPAVDIISFSHLWCAILGIALAYPHASRIFARIQYTWAGIVLVSLLFLVTYVFAMTSTFSPFIYFRF